MKILPNNMPAQDHSVVCRA